MEIEVDGVQSRHARKAFGDRDQAKGQGPGPRGDAHGTLIQRHVGTIRRASDCGSHLGGAQSAGGRLLSTQTGSLVWALYIASVGAQLYCGTVSPLSFFTASDSPRQPTEIGKSGRIAAAEPSFSASSVTLVRLPAT